MIGSPCGLWSCRACTLLLVYCLEHRLLNTKLNPLSVGLFRLSLLFLGGSLLMFVGSDGIAMMATTRTSQCMMEAMTSAASGSRCNRLICRLLLALTDLFDMHGQRSRLQKNTTPTNLLLAEQQRHQPPTDHCTWSIVSRRRRSIRRRRLVKKHCSAATTTTTSHMNHRRAEGLKRMITQIFIIN